MRSRNLILLLTGVTVALVTLFVSWRFGFVFFLLPLFFVWSWGGGGDRRAGRRSGVDDGPAVAEEEPATSDDAPATAEEEPTTGEDGLGSRPPAGSGLDGEGI